MLRWSGNIFIYWTTKHARTSVECEYLELTFHRSLISAWFSPPWSLEMACFKSWTTNSFSFKELLNELALLLLKYLHYSHKVCICNRNRNIIISIHEKIRGIEVEILLHCLKNLSMHFLTKINTITMTIFSMMKRAVDNTIPAKMIPNAVKQLAKPRDCPEKSGQTGWPKSYPSMIFFIVPPSLNCFR